MESELLRSTISGLRRVSDSHFSDSPHARNETRTLLSDFSARLSTYFDAEESGGYFGTISTDCPGLLPKVADLEQAHTDLRLAVASLRRLVRDGTGAADVGRRIGVVIDDFETLEHAENDLLQEFFLRDQGSSE
jgi:hypothetical protein